VYRYWFLTILILFWLTGCTVVSPDPTPTPTPMPAPTPTPEWFLEGWELVWQDEFNGNEVNRDNWAFDLGRGNGGWGNNEWQWYTERPENVRIEEGILIIEAHEEEFLRGDYTSGRMKTEGLHAWQFGRVEARIQLPAGQGIWPAFWMLGTEGGGWPNIGEIDIMENIGREPNKVHGTVHGPGYSGANGVGHSYILSEEPFAEDFHIFAIEWEPNAIRWYVDGNNFSTITPEDVPGDWVYDDHPFFLILNVAVGGHWPGYPDETTTFPQQMLIDYIRVYQQVSGG
jgi:beta-glucanase (GH16 family)